MNDYLFASTNSSLEDPVALAKAQLVAFDIEGSGTNLGTSIPYGFSLAYNPSGAYYASIGNQYLKAVLANPNRLKIAHNASYDRSMMKKGGLIIDNLCDTMIAAHLLGEPMLSLKALALKKLGLNVVSFSELGKKFDQMSLDEMLEYSGPHSMAALMLWEVFEKEMRKLKLLDVFWNIEMPLVPVISDMELNGVMVDRDVLATIGEEIDGKVIVLKEALDHWSERPGMNHNSPDQVADLLYNEFGLPTGRLTKSGSRSTVDAKYIETLRGRHPYIGPYLLLKQLQTLKNSYINSLSKQIVNGRVYGSFNQTGTRTSRLSSSDPNLQKIPVRTPMGKRIRTAFVAPEGCLLVKADYDLIELKKMAHCSQDPHMLEAFRAGRDIHTETAIFAFGSAGERSKGKTLNFQMIYGGGDAKLRQAFFDAYPGVLPWTKATIAQAQEAGYVRTLGGRIRVIPEFDSPSPKVREHGGREAISTIVQGSSAEVVKIGMRRAWEELKGSGVKMLLQVHDELVFEVPYNQVRDVIEVLQRTMPYYEFSIPLTVSIEVGKNWGEMEKIPN